MLLLRLTLVLSQNDENTIKKQNVIYYAKQSYVFCITLAERLSYCLVIILIYIIFFVVTRLIKLFSKRGSKTPANPSLLYFLFVSRRMLLLVLSHFRYLYWPFGMASTAELKRVILNCDWVLVYWLTGLKSLNLYHSSAPTEKGTKAWNTFIIGKGCFI